MIHFVEVDSKLGALNLEVADSQKTYVASVLTILAKAYLFRKYRTQCFWIYEEDSAVGMVLWFDDPEKESYEFSQLFIDQRYQGRGYGRAATKEVLNRMRQEGKYRKVTLCYVEGNDGARKMYEQFGFVEISHEWDEIFMEMKL